MSETTENKDRYFTYFYCDHGDENAEECRVMLKEVKAELGADDSNLLTRVVYELEWGLPEPAYIRSIPCDMWAAVSAETHQKGADGEPLFKTYIQCDMIEHGIAGTWKAFRERFPS